MPSTFGQNSSLNGLLGGSIWVDTDATESQDLMVDSFMSFRPCPWTRSVLPDLIYRNCSEASTITGQASALFSAGMGLNNQRSSPEVAQHWQEPLFPLTEALANGA